MTTSSAGHDGRDLLKIRAKADGALFLAPALAAAPRTGTDPA